MDIVHEVAGLYLCEDCGEHGDMIFPISGREYEVLSKKEAFEYLWEERVSCPTLPFIQVMAILAQIHMSGMPEYTDKSRVLKNDFEYIDPLRKQADNRPN